MKQRAKGQRSEVGDQKRGNRKEERGKAYGRWRLEDRELRSLEVGGKTKDEGRRTREEILISIFVHLPSEAIFYLPSAFYSEALL
jgi:hypothetical protein